MPTIVRITEWPAGTLDELVHESEVEGFAMLTRLRHEWASQANRFNQPGEALFGMVEAGRWIAVGGVNRESPQTGRLRRFYVQREMRRRGIGRYLARHLLQFAARNYTGIVLRTHSEVADKFYVGLGFIRMSSGGTATHFLTIAGPDHFGITHIPASWSEPVSDNRGSCGNASSPER